MPQRGPALLVCNHVSLVDGFLVGLVRAAVRPLPGLQAVLTSYRCFHWLLKLMKAIPIAAGSRSDFARIARSRHARSSQQGHVVCVFAEGSISRTGNLLPFKRGFERIVEGLDVPIIPVYLDRVWGSIFSFKGGRFFWKWPSRIPYPVTVAFGRAARRPRRRAAEVAPGDDGARRRGRQRAAGPRSRHSDATSSAPAKRRWSKFCMADSSGTIADLRARARRRSAALALAAEAHCREKNIGLLLPSSVGGALANIAVTLSGKVAVNLNFTAGRESMAYAIQHCGIRNRPHLARVPVEGAISNRSTAWSSWKT